MANRIIVATLYQASGSSPAFLLNVSPRVLVTYAPGDQIFLTVNLDSSVPDKGTAISCAIDWNAGSRNPFTATPNMPTAVATPTSMGYLSPGAKNIRYTLSITYNGNTYVEDPDMQINS